MSRGTKWLVGVVGLLAVILVAADRIAVAVMEGNTSKALASYSVFQDKPDVTLHGIPFLTQAFGGTYDDVSIASNSTTVGEIKGAILDVHLYGAKLPLSDLLSNSVKSIPVRKVQGSVVAPYSELARLSGVEGLVLSEQNGELVVKAPIVAPVVGTVNVEAKGAFDIVNGKLVLAVHSLKVQGVELPQALVAAAAAAFTSAIDVPALPYGLHLTSTSATPKGLRLNGEGDNVVLRQLPPS